MQTLINKKPHLPFPPNLHPPNFFSSRTHKDHHFLKIHPQRCRYTSKILTFCSAVSAPSLGCGGWDDFQLSDDSTRFGESNQLNDFLSSLGIGDKKYAFVYLFGFVCALAISRVRISSIIVFPACAIVFALGFSVGLVKGGHLKELRVNGSRKKIVDDANIGFVEKFKYLKENLQGCNAKVLNLKNGIEKSIDCHQVTLSDLEGYADVIRSVDMSFVNAIDILDNCTECMLGGNQENEIVSEHESGRRRKKSGEKGLSFFQYFDGLFGGKLAGPKPGKVGGPPKMEMMDVEMNNKKNANILSASVKERNQNFAPNGDLENKGTSKLDSPFASTVRAQNGAENVVGKERRNMVETNDTAEAAFDQTIYNYRKKTSRFVNNQQVHLKDYQDEIETMSSQNNSYNSVDVSISMNHIKTEASFGHQHRYEETLNTDYSHLGNTRENQQESLRYSYGPRRRSPVANQEFARDNAVGNDLEFDRYLAEANNLFKEAKGCLAQQVVDDSGAEDALHKSAILLSKAIDIRPMSLLAVGQLGNTYLLHGELKLRMSRDLRSLLVRNDPLSADEWEKVLNRFDDKLVNKDKITSALVIVCEECEELLIKAGRKYKLALSIDGNDMRALYNWGLALSFRAQLIADIGPNAARDADKVFLAAIDKFDAMMSRSNVYAPDALFRWGAALQQRAQLRPRQSKEKVKLLKQARQLYEDALHFDSGNRQLQRALSSCMSELDYYWS